jgi:hypothetical protein
VPHALAATLLSDPEGGAGAGGPRYFRWDPEGLGDFELADVRPENLRAMLNAGHAALRRSDAAFTALCETLAR